MADPKTAQQLQTLKEDYGFLVSREAPADQGSAGGQTPSRLTPDRVEELLLGIYEACRGMTQHNREVAVASQE
ncbi:MAG: hypothetical protein ACKOJF_03475, partial [Planctomycetaceae bacterium]